METVLSAIAHASTTALSLLPHDPIARSAVTWALTVVLLYVAYRFLFRDRSKTSVDLWVPGSQQFDNLRRAAYPPPFPNGWYKLCDLEDLDNARVQSVSALGLNLVIYKSKKSGNPVVMDAFCPHLGAHLGVGGTVTDHGIVCPFHGWCLGEDGKVVDIPYCDGTIPANKVTRVYRHRVWMGCVMFWFHCDNFCEEADRAGGAELVAPEWELAELTADARAMKWPAFVVQQSTYKQHICEMASNSPDYFHFNWLHGKFDFHWLVNWFTDRTFKIHHETRMFDKAEKHGKHHLFFDNHATVSFCGFPFSFASQLTEVDMEGPSIIHFHIVTAIGSVHLLKTLLPLDHWKMHVEDKWFRNESLPLWAAHLLAFIAKKALEQDRGVWENKTMLKKPMLVKGDGPFPTFHKWYRTFYSEGSDEYCDTHKLGRYQW